jgi:hypothetical protein
MPITKTTLSRMSRAEKNDKLVRDVLSNSDLSERIISNLKVHDIGRLMLACPITGLINSARHIATTQKDQMYEIQTYDTRDIILDYFVTVARLSAFNTIVLDDGPTDLDAQWRQSVGCQLEMLNRRFEISADGPVLYSRFWRPEMAATREILARHFEINMAISPPDSLLRHVTTRGIRIIFHDMSTLVDGYLTFQDRNYFLGVQIDLIY